MSQGKAVIEAQHKISREMMAALKGRAKLRGRRLEQTHRHGRLMGGRFVRASGATRGANPISPRRGEDPGAQGLPPRGVIS
jgi:hypothetical protein